VYRSKPGLDDYLEKVDLSIVLTKGSHRQYKHAKKPGRVTIAGHPSDEMAPGTLNSVLKQAQLKNSKNSER
jgi:predicted RNA binding protein YcfA (HicA-like mRNA interferase family)